MSVKSECPSIVLDCSNLACPEPVLRCRALCKSAPLPESLTVIVDNLAALENVSRFLSSRQYRVKVILEGSKWRIQARLNWAELNQVERQINPLSSLGQDNKEDILFQGVEPIATSKCGDQEQGPSNSDKILVFLTSDVVGSGDDALGAKLMLSFLSTLPELGSELWRIILLNSGVRLSTQEHPAMPKLKALEDAGADVLVCGACLEHFALTTQKKVGQITNMLDVVTSLQLADKIIKP